MFLSISEWITGRIPPGNVQKELRRFPAAALSFLIVTCLGALPRLQAAPSFERSTFSRINFTGFCTQKQWTLTTDNSLQLLIAPSRQGPCEAILEFHFPQEVNEHSAIAFEARSLRPGPFLRIGIQEQQGASPFYTSSFPPHGLGTEWKKDGARLNRLKSSRAPQQVTAIRFVALPNPNWESGGTTVMIRHMRFVTPALAPAPEKTVPLATAPLPPSKRQSAAYVLLPALAGMVLLAIVFGNKSRRRRILSPLYEINTRTWKTYRDANGVVQFGGFKKITLSDLKAVKEAGFNTVWLMGLWEVGPRVRDISKNYAADYQGSPFAIHDYCVSSDLGTEQDFEDLIQRAHSLRLSVIVDFIPNHMGLDSAWLNDHPEYFIHRVLNASDLDLSDEELKQRYPSYFPYRTPSYPQGDRRVPKTLMVAYGKDPYFYPWIDTAQLDYAHPGLRQKMIDLLCYWAKRVDGVRCDMAMLILREQVKIHRHPDMSWETFNQLMPGEFWKEAIEAVKRVNPHFVFLAETYWSMEGCLQNLGFDYTYNKPLYEAICSAVHGGHAEGLMNFLRLLGTDFLKRSVHFLENHDEDRVMNILGEERQKAAAAILCTLPGIALLHQGQLEGKRERIPVQRVVPLHREPEHPSLDHFYRRLLKATSLPVFQEGRLTPLYSNNPALASYARLDNETKVLVIVNTSQKHQRGSVFLMPGLRLYSGAQYRLRDLFFEFKGTPTGTVRPFYTYPAAQLINQGLYVELEPFDAHIFVVEPQGALQTTQKLLVSVRHVMEEWSLNRLTRRVFGAALSRSSDMPTGRHV